MCHTACLRFGKRALIQEEVEGKKIIEVGSQNINGSLRGMVMNFRPFSYIGVDIVEGPGVDAICNAENMVQKFGGNSFDVVISTEMLEHVENWRKAISNIKNICKPEGIILITTRSRGFPLHEYPNDFWRFELEDMEAIFSDCKILILKRDSKRGVFLKVKKPKVLNEKDLSDILLFNINSEKRVR